MASGTSRVSAGFLCVEQQRAAQLPLAWSSGRPKPLDVALSLQGPG